MIIITVEWECDRCGVTEGDLVKGMSSGDEVSPRIVDGSDEWGSIYDSTDRLWYTLCPTCKREKLKPHEIFIQQF